MTSEAEKMTRGHCPTCAADRRAIVRGQHVEEWDYQEIGIDGSSITSILECAGCGAIYFQKYVTSSEDNEDGPSLQHWPIPARRKRPEWVTGFASFRLDGLLLQILKEIYAALDNDLRILAAVGMRTCLERAMTLLDIPDETFAERLKRMVVAHHIGESQRASLEILTEAGNAAAHRSWQPGHRELRVLMDVLEPFIQYAFVVKAEAAALRAKVPKRGQPPEKQADGRR